MKTRTGGYDIGFRRLNSAWQKDLAATLAWAKAEGLSVIDLTTTPTAEEIDLIKKSGLRIGSIDIPGFSDVVTRDKAKRDAALAKDVEHFKTCAAVGSVNHFVVMIPDDKALSRKENFELVVEAYSLLAPELEACDARISIEGWPGPGALCCTPETLRAFFKEVPSKAMGINYDPSHLIRMGIDPLRFLREFGDRVVHTHGKDTEILTEELYEFGHEQAPALTKPRGWGGATWRYTIPGHGQMRWSEGFRILEGFGYKGCVSVELEDADFNGSEEGEKLGLLKGARFLEGC